MSEEIDKYYKLLGVTKSMPEEDIYKAYIAKREELFKKKVNNVITSEEYDKEIKELELAYAAITKENNNLSIKQNDEDEEIETEVLEEQLKHAMEKESASHVTVKRGRLIRKIQAEISKIKGADNLSESDLENLKKLEDLLNNEIDNHKRQLSTRYKTEFLDKKATIRAIFTTLPKGMGLQVKKISNCIDELKQAKTNKERIFGVVDLAKSFGMLAATPVIFTVKFIVQHWYLLLLLLLLLPNLKLFNFGKGKSDDYNDDVDPELEEAYDLETSYDEERVPNLGVANEPSLVGDAAPGEAVPAPTKDYGIDKSGNLVSVDNSGVVETATENAASQVTVINSGAKEEYFNLLRQALPSYFRSSYTVFDTYQEALEYCINTYGYTAKEAQDLLLDGKLADGTFALNKPSIMWLVGEGGFYADSEIEMLQNYTQEQLAQMVADNQELVTQAVGMSRAGSTISEIFESLGKTGLLLFTCYELIQYGLVGPTYGASLLLPG